MSRCCRLDEPALTLVEQDVAAFVADDSSRSLSCHQFDTASTDRDQTDEDFIGGVLRRGPEAPAPAEGTLLWSAVPLEGGAFRCPYLVDIRLPARSGGRGDLPAVHREDEATQYALRAGCVYPREILADVRPRQRIVCHGLRHLDAGALEERDYCGALVLICDGEGIPPVGRRDMGVRAGSQQPLHDPRMPADSGVHQRSESHSARRPVQTCARSDQQFHHLEMPFETSPSKSRVPHRAVLGFRVRPRTEEMRHDRRVSTYCRLREGCPPRSGLANPVHISACGDEGLHLREIAACDRLEELLAHGGERVVPRRARVGR